MAFETVGIDFAGPLFIKEMDRTESKEDANICSITWATTRATYLATDDFVLAFRRFIAQRGLYRIVYSDNMKTFKKAHTVFIQLWKKLESAEVYETSSQTLLSSGDLYVSTLFGKAASMNQ